jgi:hypothetical protein
MQALIGQVDLTIENITKAINAAAEVRTSLVLARGANDATEENLDKQNAARIISSASILASYRFMLQTEKENWPANIADLISFDFIEAGAIDGYNANATVFQGGNKTVSQFIYGNCNSDLNELIFDLRPELPSEGPTESGYSTISDETGYNQTGTNNFPASVSGVSYVPAVVFREYPFSTVERMSVSGAFPEVEGTASAQGGEDVYFGPVFSEQVNPDRPKRVSYTYPVKMSLSTEHAIDAATKFLDVIPIYNTDVTGSSLGRSDEEVSNVQQMTGKYVGGSGDSIYFQSYHQNFQPVVNEISIARHGLRTQDYSTTFNFYKDVQGGVGTDMALRNLVRWQLLLDHWNQHNVEYLSGSISLRGMPEIRVGYRVDWVDRNESYYVESVSHSWQYGQPLTTSIQVTRGQRNDPFPAYVLPTFLNNESVIMSDVSGNRRDHTDPKQRSRLGEFFAIKNTQATRNAVDADGVRNSRGEGSNILDEAPNPERGGQVVYPITGTSVLDATKADSLNQTIKTPDDVG